MQIFFKILWTSQKMWTLQLKVRWVSQIHRKNPTLEMLRLNFPDLAKSLSLPEENALSNLLAKSFNQSMTQGTSMFFLSKFCISLTWFNLLVFILFPKLFWLWKFEAEGWESAKCLRSLEQFIQTVKGLSNFWNRILF